MATTTVKDLRSIIRDEARPIVAERMLAAEERAREAAQKAKLDGAVNPLAPSDGFDGAKGDRQRGVLFSDPHKGRGLEFARCVKALAVGRMDNRNAVDVAKEWAPRNRAYEGVVRALSEGSFSGMGGLVPPEMAAEFIEMLYAATVTAALGSRYFEFNGTIDLGKQNSSAAAYWVGEAANITPSQPGVGTLGLKRKKLAALVPLTNELLRNPSVAADTFVRDDILRVMSLKADLAALRGAGTEFSPRGIKNWIASANSNAMTGTPTLATKVADLVKAIRLVDESDVSLTRGGFAMSPRVKWDLYAQLDSNGNPAFAPMLQQGNLYGFPVKTTSQIPNNLGGGTESEIYFGEWPELIDGHDVGTPMAIETFKDGTYHDGSALVSGISADQSVIRALEGRDFAVRHNKAFSMITGVTWGA